MKFARYWPMAAAMFGVGLVYVVLAQADSKPPAAAIPQPVDAVFETAEAPWSPSDLPRLECVEAGICATDKCTTGECVAANTVCPPCSPVAQTACSTQTACQTHAACQTACPTTNVGACQTACASTVKACVSTAACECGANCACATECACGANCACATECACGKTCACDNASTFAIAGECGIDCAVFNPFGVYAAPHRLVAGACASECACAENCKCGTESVARGPQCPAAVWRETDRYAPILPPGPVMHVWAAPSAPPPPGQGPFPPAFIPGPPPGEVHHALHTELVHAMTENARLQARDEAWKELQNRYEKMAELAVENARLQMQVEFASHKEELYESLVESAVKNATLEAKLEAFEERQKLVEALMEVTTEKAKLEAAAEMAEAHHELHAEAIHAMVEARQEMFEPLHEALVENASLKAQAAAHKETTVLKARIAELEHVLGKIKKPGKSPAPAAETAEKPSGDSETK